MKCEVIQHKVAGDYGLGWGFCRSDAHGTFRQAIRISDRVDARPLKDIVPPETATPDQVADLIAEFRRRHMLSTEVHSKLWNDLGVLEKAMRAGDFVRDGDVLIGHECNVPQPEALGVPAL